MTLNENLARFALSHIEKSTLHERPALLEAAAAHLPRTESELCLLTAAFLRHAEEHQLKLFETLFLSKESV